MVLKGGFETQDLRLGRLPQFDSRSRRFSLASLVEEKPIVGRGWHVGLALHQIGGSCVGFSWAYELIATPKRIKFLHPHQSAMHIYYEAQKIDPWEGGAYDGAEPQYEGSSVLAGAQTCQKLGYIDSYRWAFSLEDALRAVSHEGPVILGINWHEGMLEPDRKGVVHAIGEVVGGHAILCSSVRLSTRQVVLHNSWGNWGLKGKCLLSFDDLGTLLDADGECCLPIR